MTKAPGTEARANIESNTAPVMEGSPSMCAYEAR